MKIKIQIINGAALVKGKDERIFPIFEGVEEINRFDYNLKSRNKAVRTLIDILEDDGGILLQNFEYSLGSGKNFIEHLEIKCRDLWPDNEHIDQMFSRLKLEYDEGKDRESNEIIESFTSPSDESISVLNEDNLSGNEIDEEEIEDDFEVYSEEIQSLMNEVSEEQSVRVDTNSQNKKNIKSWTVVVVSGLLFTLVMGIIVYFSFYGRDQPDETSSVVLESSSSIMSIESVSQIDLQVLVEAKRFSDALEIYPQEYPYIERSIFYLGIDGIPYLEDFLKVKDYQKGWYDLAYLKRDYVKVIELKSEADTDERLAQLAVAYVKTGAIAEAEALNGQLMVESINELIIKAKTENAVQLIKNYQFDEAKVIQAEVNNERINTFFVELDKVNAALTEVSQKLAAPDIKPEDKQKLEEQKNQLEAHKQTLIEAL